MLVAALINDQARVSFVFFEPDNAAEIVQSDGPMMQSSFESDSGYQSKEHIPLQEPRHWVQERLRNSTKHGDSPSIMPFLSKARAIPQARKRSSTDSTKSYTKKKSRSDAKAADVRASVRVSSTLSPKARRSRAMASIKRLLLPFSKVPPETQAPSQASERVANHEENGVMEREWPQLHIGSHYALGQRLALGDDVSINSYDTDSTMETHSLLSDGGRSYGSLSVLNSCDFIRVKSALVRVFVDRIVKRRQYAPITQTATVEASTNTTLSLVASSGPEKTGESSRKRPRQRDENNEALEEEPLGSPILARKRTRTKHCVVSFACPFLKRSPGSHGGCGRHVLSRIRDVKQHLNRCHLMPIYCGRCGAIFSTAVLRDQHLQDEERCPKEGFEIDGISVEQTRLLSKRADPNQSHEEQWYAIFDILFPGHQPRPDSPYLDESLRQALAGAEDLMQRLGPAAIDIAIQSLPPGEVSRLSEVRNAAMLLKRVWGSVAREIFDIVMNRSSSLGLPAPKLEIGDSWIQPLLLYHARN